MSPSPRDQTHAMSTPGTRPATAPAIVTSRLSATIVARDYFRTLPGQGSATGATADFGTVQPGAFADLLLLDGDPSADIGALKGIAAVIAGGRYYGADSLKAMLALAAAAGKKQPRPN